MVSGGAPGVRAAAPVAPSSRGWGCASGGCARPSSHGAGGREDNPGVRAGCGATTAPSALRALPWEPTRQSSQTHWWILSQKKELLPNNMKMQKQCQQCIIVDMSGSCLKKQMPHMGGIGRT